MYTVRVFYCMYKNCNHFYFASQCISSPGLIVIELLYSTVCAKINNHVLLYIQVHSPDGVEVTKTHFQYKYLIIIIE